MWRKLHSGSIAFHVVRVVLIVCGIIVLLVGY